MIIFKYALEATDFQEIRLPRGAEVLHVGCQRGDLFLWAMVNDDADIGPRWFEINGTGNRLPDRPEYKRNFIGTVILPVFVWHVFELTER